MRFRSNYYDVLLDKGYTYRYHFLPHDGTRRNIGIDSLLTTQQMFEELIAEDPTKRLGKTLICAKPHRKIHAINGTRGMFHSFYFNEATVAKGLKRLSLYRRKYLPQQKSFAAEPSHDENSHAADAFMNLFLGRDEIDLEWSNMEYYKPKKVPDVNLWD